jgi:hypothetical protein
MGPLIGVGNKHHAPRRENLGRYGEGALFRMETTDGKIVVRCFVTDAAIRALQGRLDGEIMSVSSSRVLLEVSAHSR